MRIEKITYLMLLNNELSVKEIMQTKNIELRYFLLSKIPRERILKEGNWELISATKKGNELYESKTFIDNTTIQMLTYECPSTGRRYYKLFRKNLFKNADEAQAWCHHTDIDNYSNLEIES